MGTDKHSRASRKRWADVPKQERVARMKKLSQDAWDKLDARARRRRAKKSVRTRKANLLELQKGKS